uniref:Uncharacterized protein n=1 Tax=Eutreptiella gymnastica TaxID=73025 RepID=A0A7S4FZL9_9EUGL
MSLMMTLIVVVVVVVAVVLGLSESVSVQGLKQILTVPYAGSGKQDGKWLARGALTRLAAPDALAQATSAPCGAGEEGDLCARTATCPPIQRTWHLAPVDQELCGSAIFGGHTVCCPCTVHKFSRCRPPPPNQNPPRRRIIH